MAYTFKGDPNDVPVYFDLGQDKVLTYRTNGTIATNSDGPNSTFQPQFHAGVSLTSPVLP